jgi:sterol 3beta-glucosyltransferase
MGKVPSMLFGSVVNEWRKEVLGLTPQSKFTNELVQADGTPVPVLLAMSPHVVPPPADWPETVHVTGYWFLDEGADWEPPDALLAFLADGPPPVFVSFGSMAGRHPERTAAIVLDALAQTGERGLIVTGWGGLKLPDPPANIYITESIPHDWLMPRVGAVVHHGGAGTTAAGLRAGKPTIICPFVADQPFWGRRVAALGVGPAPIPQRKLTPEKLAAAIRQAMSDEDMKRAAGELGAKIRSENGIERAVERVEQSLSLSSTQIGAHHGPCFSQ